MRRLLFTSLLVVANACSFQHGSLTGGGDDGGPRDGAIDAPPDAPPDAFDPLCYGKGAFYTCLATEPTTAISFTNAIDTTACKADINGGSINGTVVAVGSTSMVCMFAGTSITIGSALAGAFGDKPLLLIASGNISIPSGATLDGRSAAYPTAGNPSNGPGANPAVCGTAPDGAASGSGAGGGGGGTLGSKGGNGGAGAGAAGGQANAVAAISSLHGGCSGGKGGQGGSGSARSNGGAGGGAIAMFARGTMQIDGAITVSGAGGGGGQASRGGGGGGGSGGMVVLSAAAITVGTTGQIQANGGGGGAGAGNSQDGDHGQDAIVFDQAAAGGVFCTGGATPGGAGAFKSTAAVSPAAGSNGGPGAGGGVGVIRVLSGQTLPAARISPPQS